MTGGELEIATVASMAGGILPQSINIWRKRAPNVAISLHEYLHRDALERDVLAGVGDIAVGPTPEGWEGETIPLGSEEFVVILPPGDRAGKTGRVALSRLADREWVLFKDGHGLSEWHLSWCAAAGFKPKGTVRTGHTDALIMLAAAGLGAGLVPGNIVPQGLAATVCQVDPPILRPIAAYTRSRFSTTARSYVEVLRATVADMPSITAS